MVGKRTDATVHRPVRSPNLNPNDYFLWDASNTTPVYTEAKLWRCIEDITNILNNNDIIF